MMDATFSPRYPAAAALSIALAGLANCSSDAVGGGAGGAVAASAREPDATDSAATLARVRELRARFVISPPPVDAHWPGPQRPAQRPRAVIGARGVEGFERGANGGLRGIVSASARRQVLRAASVELPARASGMVRLEDDTTHVGVGFALRGAGDAAAAVAEGIAVYAGALGGADVVHRVHAEGTEDFVVFEERPAREELTYDVDVSNVAGLRLVSNTLEFLDESGSPRLRVAPPYVVDAKGARSAARLAVEGCAVDTDPSGPWGRAVTRAGAKSCAVRVLWGGAGYPLVVDPSWMATGSMATARDNHTATLLPSGKVLIAGGGDNGSYITSTELFDGIGSFAAAGSMTVARARHTATLLPSGKVLIAGGQNNNGTLASAELFDGLGTFAATGAMNAARYMHTATLLPSGKVLVAGGVDSSAELFDGLGTFVATGSMKAARYWHTATLLPSGKVLVAGGNYVVGSTSAELFDGNAIFAATGPMTALRNTHSATLLPSGKVLIAGGANAQSAELFDGVGTFVATGWMAAPRGKHTATLLATGKVLLAGGDNSANAELFDGMGSFAPTGAMTTLRVWPTATLLPSDQVLVTGGSTSLAANPPNTSSAELFALPLGGQCVSAGDCGSGICNEKCCATACTGTCKTCDAVGACLTVKNTPDADSCAGANSCDTAGVCKKAVGQACPGGNGDCASAFCADGFCCDKACGGACDVCAQSIGASADGVCSSAPVGYAGNPACGMGYACDGVSAACPPSCTSDATCNPSDYCAANGTCLPQKTQNPASACDTSAGADCKVAGCRVCASGHCTDGFCCDSACKGPGFLCQACSAALKQSGTGNGTCGPASDDTNPHADACPLDPSYPGNCGAPGTCNGAGACRITGLQGTVCSPGGASCSNGTLTGQICNAGGVCVNGSKDCGLYACNPGGTDCNATCASSSDCDAVVAFCAAGKCVAKTANGGACALGTDCNSGYCYDGVCCNQACGGLCQACNVAPNPGACVPLIGDPAQAGHKPCAGSGVCQGACDGSNTATCLFPSKATACGTASCSAAVTIQASACDGAGACAKAPTKNCPPYACDSSTGDCKIVCASDGDCSAGATCDTASGQCATTAGTCSDAFTAKSPNGQLVPCAPYRCKNGACQQQCVTGADCADGATCNGSVCAAAAPAAGSPAPADSGGCGCRVGTEREEKGWLGLLLGVVVLAGRRKRTARVNS